MASLTHVVYSLKKNIYMYKFFVEAGDKSMPQGRLLLKPIFLQLTPWVMVRDKKFTLNSYKKGLFKCIVFSTIVSLCNR